MAANVHPFGCQCPGLCPGIQTPPLGRSERAQQVKGSKKRGLRFASQAPVVAANLVATIDGRTPVARYDGYTACPFVTEYGKVLMAEFDYDKKPTPTLPLLDPGREHRAGWVLKRYVLKPMYFEAMLRGRA